MEPVLQRVEGRPGPTGASLPNSRDKIIAAAADVLRQAPANFSVQRVARVAGLSARAIYGHFESGAELAEIANLTALEVIASNLPKEICGTSPPEDALRLFALRVASAFGTTELPWLITSRQVDPFRTQYRQLVRLPLVRLVNDYLLRRGASFPIGSREVSRLAEFIVIAVESVALNRDAGLAIEVGHDEAISLVVRLICRANHVQ